MSNSNIQIDESSLKEEPSLFQKIRNVLIAVVLGAVLVQMILFYGAVKGGSFTPASIIIYFDSLWFVGYLIVCGVLGWFAGESFLDWLKVKIDSWKF
ncbi:MAG: hypothetical protein BalsKO_02540 [Balneolaceae bacterium]